MKISGSSEKLNPIDIKRFESEYEIKLPREYVNFLLEHNGGCPDPAYFTDGDAETYINCFYSLSKKDSPNLDEEIRVFPGCIGKGLMPIGLDGGGDIVFLFLKTGAILLWELGRSQEYGYDKFSAEDLVFLAKDIKVLLDGLYDPE